MRATDFALLGSLASTVSAVAMPDVDTKYPYTGPAVPVGDWVDQSPKGNGKGFPRLVEPPAVSPASSNPTNNINVITTSYIPNGIHIHFSTPYGLGESPSVMYGTSANAMNRKATGISNTYARSPPCSSLPVTQCNEFFHEVQISNLKADTVYYYMIPPANGTTASQTLSVKTGRAAGVKKQFSVAVLNDMGYTNAAGTHKYMTSHVESGDVDFAWHGGDISYADDWYSGVLPCSSSWPVCYNGTSTELPGGYAIPPEYLVPLPKGEIANQGGPQGGDMSVLYESNWDLWQQWMNTVTLKVPYMTLPGNHEAACAEFDGPGQLLAGYLNNDKINHTEPSTDYLTYYSCPPSQRNFTVYQNRFRMPGPESGGVGNMWYSFDYGLAHFISIDTETDFPYSPEYPFARDLSGNETHPTEEQTYITDSGPFGYIKGDINSNAAYEQYNWLAADLKKVDRTKTPWVIAMGHRPMYSSQVASYQANIRNAFEGLMLQYGVDAYFAGHIHWYERLYPLGTNGTINKAAIVNNSTYKTDAGKSIMHIVNGMAGNIESHSLLDGAPRMDITAVLDHQHYGFSKLTIYNESALSWSFIMGNNGNVRDTINLVKGA